MKDHVLDRLSIAYRRVSGLKANPRNSRTHSARQVAQIRSSIEQFGFTNPIIADEKGELIAGHGRLEAAKEIGMREVPTITLSHLSAAQKRALMLADNKIALNAGWDLEILAGELEVLTSANLDLDVTITGFETAEIDVLLAGPDTKDAPPDPVDALAEIDRDALAITRLGDLWQLGEHRLLCGSALDPDDYSHLLGEEVAQQVVTDPPYNVKVDGHVGGLGKTKHREFAMASGEMTSAQFETFLRRFFQNVALNVVEGAIVMAFMDWRHMREILEAGTAIFGDPKNLAVWNKVNGGMGSLYRSQHELIFVFKKGRAPHINNVELGRHGRYRTNVWTYPGASMFRKGRDQSLKIHPTVKPIGLIADAIKDCSNRGGIILDPFGGSGTTILASERTGRRGRLIELDPHYVDASVHRWQEMTGKVATLESTGRTFEEVGIERATTLSEDLE